MKKIFTIVITAVLLISMLINGYAIDETNNETGTDIGLNTADPGDAQVVNSSIQQSTTMWKISVYVAKNDTVEKSANETLTDNYYQFGSTFWIYRRSGAYAVELSDKDYIATPNKEEYLRGNDRHFRKGTKSSLSYRIFAGEDYGFTGENDSLRVPYVPNCGKVEGFSDSQIITAMNAFFKDNANTSNVLFNLAAIAAGYKSEGDKMPYEALLIKMINDGSFIVNGNVLREEQFNQIDPYREEIEEDVFEREASSIAYVIMYEPVIRFAMNGSADADRYYVSASDIAALGRDGIINFSDSISSMYYRFSPTYRKEHDINVIDDSKISIDGNLFEPVTKNCIRPFYINLANSVYLAENWLGYSVPSIDYSNPGNTDLWKIGSDIYAWYTDKMLEKAGFGLRFIKSDVETLEIKKEIDFGENEETDIDYKIFEFEILNKKTNEKYIVNIDENGLGTIELKPGTYIISETESIGFEFSKFTSDDLGLKEDGVKAEFTITGEKNSERITATNSKLYYNITVNYYDKYTGDIILQRFNMEKLEPLYEYDVIMQRVDTIDYPDKKYVLDIISVNGISMPDFEFKGEIQNFDIKIDLFYSYENTIKINYCDISTEAELKEPFNTQYEHLSEYDVEDETNVDIAGYMRLETLSGDETSGILDEDKEITVWYEKDEIPLSHETGDDTFITILTATGLVILSASLFVISLAKEREKGERKG